MERYQVCFYSDDQNLEVFKSGIFLASCKAEALSNAKYKWEVANPMLYTILCLSSPTG